jgi:hypothetical protein
MNRAQRRRQAAQARHNQLYRDYVRHLPTAPIDGPLEPGRVHHLVFQHDRDCGIYAVPNGGLGDCTCDPVVSRHVEPRRS